MVVAGDAFTLEPVDELSPVEGVHIYVLAPMAVSVVELPAQILVLVAVTVSVG